ncbi:hypothetical protein Csac_0613 [Caldicellulosiruptor saccharolyticus DSM 8903]|uniref:Preprotein translocase subunit SecB n=1 Tax=Caldicellulosiruptor saccharolyticus (strain ATCC 43494 / DSM 8903 / Tp8T 6331) TaxID=351627 RepID=A4XH52_CALS8|nr:MULTISPECIES: protein-export chaperone SecB [Caldicellulosiruptor]ABP66237.1 hypothetical protein Csac_0613 [Caldicellulosiruptor saccharolyticus DSM 8903]
MKEVSAPYFRFENYVVDYIHYNYNHQAKLENKPIEVRFSLAVNINVREEEKKSTVTLKCNIFGNAEENNFPFSLEISLTGYFRGSENIEREKFIELTKYNGTAILFPYLRSTVSDITKAANINPLILPVINVVNFIKEQEKKDKENSGFQGE